MGEHKNPVDYANAVATPAAQRTTHQAGLAANTNGHSQATRNAAHKAERDRKINGK